MRLLACGSVLFAGIAHADPDKGMTCRLHIGEEWVALAAGSVQDCFKYAAAAATPGEAQIAEFQTLPLAYRDGQHFVSADGGQSWAQFTVQPLTSPIKSLNSLQAASATAPEAEQLAEQIDAAPEPAAPEADPVSSLLESLARAAPPPAAPVPVAPASDQPAPADPVEVEPAAVESASTATSTATADAENAELQCRMETSDSWVLIPLKELDACTEQLLEKVGHESMERDAYFAIRRPEKTTAPGARNLRELDQLGLAPTAPQKPSQKLPQHAEIGRR